MKLSIITINYNNLDGLKRTYESVVSQTCQDFEWIIIDGGSTDGSKEFIEEHQGQFAYWCSEPDKGIYNAMNKGIAKANGEYLQFLNSGDNLVDDKVIEEFLAFGWEEDVVSGDIILDGDINEIRYNPDEEELDFDRMRSGAGVTHPSSYIKKELFDKYGLYDESLRIVSDWKFFINVLIIQNRSYRHWKRIVANFNTDGICSSPENGELHMAERAQVLGKYERIIRSIEKRDKRIQELDLPVLVRLRKKVIEKIKKIFHRHEV